MKFSCLLLIGSAFLTAQSAAMAHVPWLLPSATTLADTGSWVGVDIAASSEPFHADHVAVPVDGVKVWQPDGAEGKIRNAAKGRYRSTFDVAIDKEGTWRIGTFSDTVGGTFKVDGEEWRIAPPWAKNFPAATASAGAAAQSQFGQSQFGQSQFGQAKPGGGNGRSGSRPGGPGVEQDHKVASVADIPANATDLDLTQTVARNEVYVTAGKTSTAIFTPSGKGLEMVPITHPDALVSGEQARFRFLVDGKPAAGIKVTLVAGGKRYRENQGMQGLITSDDGMVAVTWPIAGMYYLAATAKDERPTAARAAHRSMSFAATLEVMAP